MILGFVQFEKQSRKLKKHIKKTASKKQWTKHEKSSKKGAEMEPKTMKKPSKKRNVFQGPQKSVQNHFFRGSLRQSRPKSTILSRFAIFLGSRNGPGNIPWSAKNRPKEQ